MSDFAGAVKNKPNQTQLQTNHPIFQKISQKPLFFNFFLFFCSLFPFGFRFNAASFGGEKIRVLIDGGFALVSSNLLTIIVRHYVWRNAVCPRQKHSGGKKKKSNKSSRSPERN